jgi:hypothetical protein
MGVQNWGTVFSERSVPGCYKLRKSRDTTCLFFLRDTTLPNFLLSLSEKKTGSVSRYLPTFFSLSQTDYISPTTAAPTSFKSKLNKSFTRKTSGHCLGTFQTAKLCFDYTPPAKGSVSNYPPQLSSLSLSLKKRQVVSLATSQLSSLSLSLCLSLRQTTFRPLQQLQHL